ncbi:hypothetical protein GGX14DRAFT_408633 [Mycena pura]|uniref:Uncharacterized protein n=1 Tax=Mycena pura TaxID=153505 RepID=A0AAD6UKJ5_9AGAR|nr:hypothetical protein GGX14DRAFT_408633 [Mycena pura]
MAGRRNPARGGGEQQRRTTKLSPCTLTGACSGAARGVARLQRRRGVSPGSVGCRQAVAAARLSVCARCRAAAWGDGAVGRRNRPRAGWCRAAAAADNETEPPHAHGSVRQGGGSGTGCRQAVVAARGVARRSRGGTGQRRRERARAVARRGALQRGSAAAGVESEHLRRRVPRQRQQRAAAARGGALRWGIAEVLQGGGGSGRRNRASARSRERARAAARRGALQGRRGGALRGSGGSGLRKRTRARSREPFHSVPDAHLEWRHKKLELTDLLDGTGWEYGVACDALKNPKSDKGGHVEAP